MKATIYALHGFLGKPSDWDHFPNLLLNPVDVSKYCGLSLTEFGKHFNKDVEEKAILMGYSMGGRLALHALIDSPDKWKAAIIISAHPGCLTSLDCSKRIKSDQELLKRYQAEDFDSFMQQWNDQPLFKGHQMERKKQDYTEGEIAACLTEWSLGNQENLRDAISKLPMPVLWIVGEFDEKYQKIALELKFLHPKSRIWIAKNATHRIPWQIGDKFENEVKTYIEGL